MKYYLKDLLPRLKKYSAELDHATFLTDKPWVVSGEEHGPFQKLIFRKDGRVHLSNNGDLTDGKWEYLPEAKALIIDYGSSKKLFRHEFLDEAVLALKIDGRKSDSDEDYFLLSDENKVPDANAKLHLKNKFLQENKSKAKELSYDNQAFRKIKSNIDNNDKYDEVNTKSTPLTDGMHYTEDGKTRYRILKGKALYTHNLYTYKNSIGIWQKLFIPAEEEEVTGMNEGVLNVTINNDTYIIEIKNSKVIGITNKSLQKRVLHTIAYIVLLFITIFFYLNYFE